MNILLALSLSLVSQIHPNTAGRYTFTTNNFLPTIPNEVTHSAASQVVWSDATGHFDFSADDGVFLTPFKQAFQQPTALAVMKAFALKKITALQANAQLKDILNAYLKPKGLTVTTVYLSSVSSMSDFDLTTPQPLIADFDQWSLTQGYALQSMTVQ